MSTETKPKHIGHNISRLRELRGIKQDDMASSIGVSQQAISYIENSETVDEEKLQLIAKKLGISVEAIKNFSEEVVFQIIGNTYHDNSSSLNYGCTFNPIEKLIEAYEENKKLYERLLEAERKNDK